MTPTMSTQLKLADVIADLLADSPVAEAQTVIKDLKTIVGRNINAELETALRAYNVANNVVIDCDGTDVVLSEWNADENDTFVDFARGVSVQVDHLSQKPVRVEQLETSQECVALHSQIEDYLEEKFPSQYALLVAPDAEHIVIIGEKQSPANFWNARWTSKYEIQGQSISGTVDIDVHYYEDGNVRLKTKQEVSGDIESTIAAAISKIEDKLQLSLQKTIVDINTTQFKNLRRPLPVTRSKVQWGKAIGNYRLGKDVSN